MIDDQMMEGLARYLEERAQERNAAVTETWRRMTRRERRLFREAAVMGYVRGNLAGRFDEGTFPHDSTIVVDVIKACHSNRDLYPVINHLPAPASEGGANHA